MANFKLNQTGEQIQADLDLLGSNSATQGQVLTANGTGGATWQNAKGTEVVANPTGEATEELTKLQVGSSVYSIPSGGSGGMQLYEHLVEASSKFIGEYFIFASTSQLQFDGKNGRDIPIIMYYRTVNVITLYQAFRISDSVIYAISVEGGESLSKFNIIDYTSFTDTVTPL